MAFNAFLGEVRHIRFLPRDPYLVSLFTHALSWGRDHQTSTVIARKLFSKFLFGVSSTESKLYGHPYGELLKADLRVYHCPESFFNREEFGMVEVMVYGFVKKTVRTLINIPSRGHRDCVYAVLPYWINVQQYITPLQGNVLKEPHVPKVTLGEWKDLLGNPIGLWGCEISVLLIRHCFQLGITNGIFNALDNATVFAALAECFRVEKAVMEKRRLVEAIYRRTRRGKSVARADESWMCVILMFTKQWNRKFPKS